MRNSLNSSYFKLGSGSRGKRSNASQMLRTDQCRGWDVVVQGRRPWEDYPRQRCRQIGRQDFRATGCLRDNP